MKYSNSKKIKSVAPKMKSGGKVEKMQSGGKAVLVKNAPKDMSLSEYAKMQKAKTVKDIKDGTVGKEPSKKMMNGGYSKKKMK